jgi:hypothetical protein
MIPIPLRKTGASVEGAGFEIGLVDLQVGACGVVE